MAVQAKVGKGKASFRGTGQGEDNGEYGGEMQLQRVEF
jgi:hypothetical protein